MAGKTGAELGVAVRSESYAAEVIRGCEPAPRRQCRASDALLNFLEAEGVEVIIGVPGCPLTGLFEAMEKRDTIRLVLAKHEGGAALMAASHARVKRGLAVCCGTSGP